MSLALSVRNLVAGSIGGLLVLGLSLMDMAPAMAEDECAETHLVEITHIFIPKDLVIAPGDCVRFINIHSIEHSAVGLEREFNTGTLLPGGTNVFKFDEPADIPYWCGLHPPMVGTLTIQR